MSYLPGHMRSVRANEDELCCEDGCSNDATKAVAGEVDSFGVEWLFFCEEHAKVFKDEVNKPVIGLCDWCHKDGLEISPMRDFEEGSHGPVYDVCQVCRAKKNAYQNEMNEDYDYDA